MRRHPLFLLPPGVTLLYVSASPQSLVSFGAVKVILDHYGLSLDSCDLRLAQSLRIIYPIDAGLATKVRAGSTSLTDSATANEQIRFFQHQRARRSYIKLAEYIANEFGPVSIYISDAQDLDDPSREFLDLAVRICGWSVQMGFDSIDQARSHIPRPEEQVLLDWLSPESLSSHADEVSALAFDYVNAGDAWTAIKLGRRLQDIEQSPRVWNLLALAHAMLDETLNAEFYYDRWSTSGQPLDTVRALYGKAMLYARHHPSGLRSINRSAELLDQAYALVQQLSSEDRRDDAVVFDEVFNRNGFALVLFRRGEVDEAVRLLRWGINTLKDTGEKIAIHRSVLIYNLAQCFKQSGDLQSAIATYQELLEVDPYMPEYHLEAAKCFAAASDLESAIHECRTAISLDDTLSSAWALLGVYEGEKQDYSAAAQAHHRASVLDPSSPSHLTNEVYNLILNGSLSEAAEHSATWVDGSLPRAELERRASLGAEIHLRRKNQGDALKAIDQALLQYPDSEVLLKNRGAILSASV